MGQNTLRFLICLGFGLGLVGNMPSASLAANPYYFSEKKPRISSSQLTDLYSTTPFSPNVEIGKITYRFPAKTKNVYWTGRTDIQTRPYELYALWFRPDGELHERMRCDWKGTSEYRARLKLPRKKKAPLLGQWRLEIRDGDGDILVSDRFYIGPALNILDANPADRWNNADHDIDTAAAIVLKHDVSIKVSYELGITKRIYKQVKILSEAGKGHNEYYESYKERQFPRINFAHTVLPDGAIQSDTQQFPGILQRVPPHHRSARVMFVRMLRAEPGDILEYEMTFEEPYTKGEDLFFDEFYVQDALPVLASTYTVTVPADMELPMAMLNSEARPSVTKIPDSGQVKYTWSWESVSPLIIEPNMPPYRDVGESVVVSEAWGWEDVGTWWRSHTINKYKVNDELTDLLRRILLDADTPEDKIAAIYKYAKYKIEFSGFDFDWSDPEPLPSVEVLKRESGDAKNQAVFLKTLLNQAGIDAEIALARTREKGALIGHLAGTGEFNHVMVVAQHGDREYYLDPSRKFYREWTLPARDLGAPLVVVKEDAVELRSVPPTQETDSRREILVDLQMAQDFQVSGTLRVEYFGRDDAAIKNELNGWDQNQTLNYVRTTVSQVIPGGDFSQVEVFNQKKIDRNARMEAQVRTPGPWISEGAPWKIALTGDAAVLPEYITENRTHPLHLIGLRHVRIRTRVRLPDSVTAVNLPEDLVVDSPLLAYSARFRFLGGVLALEAEFREKQAVIALEDYPEFRALYRKAAADIAHNIELVPSDPTEESSSSSR